MIKLCNGEPRGEGCLPCLGRKVTWVTKMGEDHQGCEIERQIPSSFSQFPNTSFCVGKEKALFSLFDMLEGSHLLLHSSFRSVRTDKQTWCLEEVGSTGHTVAL